MTALAMLPRAIRGATRYYKTPVATSTASHGKYEPSTNDFIGSFYAVLRRWRSETACLSDPDSITDNDSYKALVDNAHCVVPLIIEELRAAPSTLVWVLDDAIGETPYSPNQIGNITAMSNAWVAWAERNGCVL